METNSQSENPKKGSENHSVRKDVVTKTILRIMRRFFQVEFENFKETQEEKSDDELCHQFVIHLFPNITENENLEGILAYLISKKRQIIMNNFGRTTKKQIQVLRNSLYKYSQTSLSRMLESPNIELVFKHFVNIVSPNFLRKQSAFRKNEDVYWNRIRQLKNEFKPETGK